jgi:uncharacterized membrane protein YhaH (DUF805 family)
MVLKIYWWFYLVMLILSATFHLMKHGEPRGEYHAGYSIANLIIVLPWLILLWPLIMK